MFRLLHLQRKFLSLDGSLVAFFLTFFISNFSSGNVGGFDLLFRRRLHVLRPSLRGADEDSSMQSLRRIDFRSGIHERRGGRVAHGSFLLLALRHSAGRPSIHADRRPAALPRLLSKEIRQGIDLVPSIILSGHWQTQRLFAGLLRVRTGHPGGREPGQSRRDELAQYVRLFQVSPVLGVDDESPVHPEERPHLLLQRVRRPARPVPSKAGPSLKYPTKTQNLFLSFLPLFLHIHSAFLFVTPPSQTLFSLFVLCS